MVTAPIELQVGEPDALEPEVTLIGVVEEQTEKLLPATAVGVEDIVSVLFEVTLPHPGFDTVKVIVTLPANTSSALGVYSQAVKLFTLTKVPVPLEVHEIKVALEALAPAVIFTGDVPQVLTAVPAVAVGVE